MPIATYERILILAPHPDDEALAAGGLIATVLAAAHPPRVRVVVATDGDASYATAWLNGHNPAARHSFQRMAVGRRKESRAALAALGLPPENVTFWGFPDKGLEPMWQDHWKGDTPYRSRTTGRAFSYAEGNGARVPYCGAALLGLLGQEICEFRPNALVMPHPQDAHSDHRALACFTLLAVNMQRAQGDAPVPDLLAYVMWSARFQKKPVQADGVAAPWEILALTPQVQAQKADALQCYRSQARPLGLLLRQRARSSVELFARLQPGAFTHGQTAAG